MRSASSSVSSASSSYRARAWPISSCAIELVATSSSSIGAIPVHSESQKPITSSSSATERRSSARASRVVGSRATAGDSAIGRLPRLGGGALLRRLELVLDDVAARLLVRPVERRPEQVGIVELGDGLA